VGHRGELLDTKSVPFEIPGDGVWQPGEAIHGLTIRVTIDPAFTVRDIAVAMDDVPHPECPQAQAPMHRMIGATMGPGWRKAIETHLGGIQGCAHLRELLFNMATAAYQTCPMRPSRPTPRAPRTTWANAWPGTSPGPWWRATTRCSSARRPPSRRTDRRCG
jgi:predicted nucleic acid-binding Zn ribbon protein